MQAIEFSTEIKPNHTIEVPEAYAALLQTTKEFLNGYAEKDSIYDKL